MADERDAPSTTDYLVAALSPVLIMLMIGSLVFFLVEVLYEGKYSERLLHTLFFFVLGAVLVARISIEMDRARAAGYGLALGAATYVAMLTYVDYPGGGWLKSFGWLVNLGFVLLIGWSAYKLTWDCTHIDEKRKGAGRGLLSAAGLEGDAGAGSPTPLPAGEGGKKPAALPGAGKKKKKSRHDTRVWDWIERYRQHRDEERRKGHTPGVWVIYFALAALPLFALGQSLIDPEDETRRRATFIQMAVYVGSALGLLVTTSFLGLRRYLRQRKARVPATMTASWLGFGMLLIVVFLALGAFLPRPHSEVPWFGISRAGKSDREASRYAVDRSSAGKGEGTSGEQTKAGDGDASGKNGKPGGGARGQKGSGSGNKGNGGRGQKGKSNSGKGDNDGGKSDSRDSEDKNGDSEKDDDSASDKKDREDSNDSERTGTASKSADARDKAESRERGRGESRSTPQLGGVVEKVAGLLKWIVYAIVAILVVGGIALAVLRYLAPFTLWARRLLDAIQSWWAGLFGRRRGESKPAAATVAAPAGPVRPPPFHEFSNPFSDGSSDTRDPAELIAYSFQALDSWAWDHDCGREPTETPLEFAVRLGEAFPELSEIVGRFARLYARAAYSELPLPGNALEILEQTWEVLVHGVAVAG